jgi:tetratricopeptide (TPR) repeat protein
LQLPDRPFYRMGCKKAYRKLLFTLAISLVAASLHCQNNIAFDSLTKALITAQNPGAKSDILLDLSKEVVGNHPDDGIKYAKEAYDIAQKHNLNRETILCLIQLGNCYVRISDYQKAFESAEKAIEMAAESKFKTEAARAKGIMALIYYELGDYEKSAKYDFENLGYYEEINNQKEIGVVLGNIGIDFISQDNYTKGLEYLKKSFDIAVKINDFHGMAYQYNNIAGVYSEYFNDYKIALGYYKSALEINKKLADKQQHGIYLMNIGNCYSKLKEKDSILIYYQKANKIFRNLNNSDLIAECQTLIGEYYLQLNNLSQSLVHADSALNIGMQNKYKEKIKAAAGLLHRIYLNKKDTIRAYKYAMIEDEAKDSLFILQNQKEVYKLEFQYNFEKNDKIKQIARHRKETILVVVILSLISGLIIVLLLFSRHRFKAKSVVLEKESIEKELHFKNKELTINLISLIKKNEMLSEISNELVEIEKGAKKDETKEAINKISRRIRNNADDKMLKEFSLRFQEVHSGFYEALLRKYPDLTQNELKLCAFLRLNMSSKEMSELTGQSILTIDHARYRLRKKLGITNSETNLVTFLSQI